MFFIGIFGTRSKVVPVTEIANTICPVCGKKTTFHICRTYNYIHFCFIPFIRYHQTYIATCSSCACVFSLDTQVGKHLQDKNDKTITASDLHLLQNNNISVRCPFCDTMQPPESRYCNRCGGKLF